MRIIIKILFYLSLLFLVCPILIFSAATDDPAMDFYLKKTDSALNSTILFNNDLKQSVSINSIYSILNYRGILSESDTAKFAGDLLNGRFSETKLIDSAILEENSIPSNIQFEKPWEFNCRFYFFPRDTGAGDLALGFAPADTLDKNAPEGMIIINRDNYQIQRVYLHYLGIEDYEWLSKTYHFEYKNETALLRLLTIQGCYYGFFQRRYFRQDLIFDDYDY